MVQLPSFSRKEFRNLRTGKSIRDKPRAKRLRRRVGLDSVLSEVGAR
jgi:hypothetical protein